jgi:hypothetical protein
MSRREEIDKQLKKTYQALLSTNDPIIQEQLEYLVKVLLREKESLSNPQLQNIQVEPVKDTKAQSPQAQSTKTQSLQDERKEIETKLIREVSDQPRKRKKDLYVFKLPDKALRTLYDQALENVNKNDSEEEQGQNAMKIFLGFAVSKFISMYRTDSDLLKAINEKCYVQLKVKVQFYRDINGKKDITDQKFEEQQFKQREYLAQSLEDLEKILKKQSERIYEKIVNFSRTDSPWVIQCPLYYSVKLIPFKPNFNNAKGFIETLAWLKRRKAIINIKNKDDQCFIKCIHRALNYDPKNRNNARDISNNQLQEFIKQHNIDLSMFSEGYTPAVLTKFEEKNTKKKTR